MKIQKSLIIEDNLEYKEILEEYISRLPFFAAPDVCTSAEHAIRLLSQTSYDIIFLDIALPGLSGIEFLKTFQQKLPVVITTSHLDFALESFDLDIIDYLIKPITYPRFVRAVNRALAAKVNIVPKKEIFLKTGRKLQLFKYDEIEYIEAEGNYSRVWHSVKFILVNDSISVIQEKLPKESFIRVHKSFIVNISFMTSYDHRTVWLNETKIPIGEIYRKAFQKSIDELSE